MTGAEIHLDVRRASCKCTDRMTTAATLTHHPMIDFSGERCADSVRNLSGMTRVELEAFLEATARASASVLLVAPRRPKPEKIRRDWRRFPWR